MGGAGRQLFDQAGKALADAATEYIGNAINEIFERKQTDQKRVLPSIKNMKVVSTQTMVGELLYVGDGKDQNVLYYTIDERL